MPNAALLSSFYSLINKTKTLNYPRIGILILGFEKERAKNENQIGGEAEGITFQLEQVKENIRFTPEVRRTVVYYFGG